MNTYKGSYDTENWYQVTKNDKPFDHQPSLKVRNHSPDGFAWGYGGSGPAQLALAILLEETNRRAAEALYQQFKAEVIAALSKDNWSLTSDDVRDWLQEKGLTYAIS